MKIVQAERKHAKIKMCLQGPSGSGKTYSALLIAYGLCGSWEKIVVIDSENGSAHLYSDFGEYRVIHLGTPFTPERYIEAITMIEEAGDFEVIVVDSISHEWETILQEHSKMAGNSYANWAKFKPRHNAFIQKMLQTNIHLIATMRTKQDYVLTEKNGKMVPEKVGLKANQRDDTDYEFTLSFNLDISHYAKVTKDRTSIFSYKPPFVIDVNVGRIIKDWCETGTSIKEVKQQIKDCMNLKELREIYKKYHIFKEPLNDLFMLRSKQLKELQTTNSLTLKTSQNGHSNSKS